MNNREIVEGVLNWAFSYGEDAGDLIDKEFVYQSGDPGKTTGLSAFTMLREQLSESFLAYPRSRSWGRSRVISHLRFFAKPANFDPGKPYPLSGRPSFSSVWLWRVQDGRITELAIYREKLEFTFFRNWLGFFFKLRAALLVVVLFWFAVLSDQALEVLRQAAGSPGDPIPYSLLMDSPFWPFFLGLTVAGYCALVLSISAEHTLFPARNRSGRLWAAPVKPRQVALSCMIAAQPSLAMGFALWLAAKPVADRAIVHSMFLYMGFQWFLALAIMVSGGFLLVTAAEDLPATKFRNVALAILVTSLAATFFCQLFTEGGWGIAPAVIAARLAIILCILGFFAFVADRTRVPILAIIAVILVIFSYFGLDDHHVVRSKESAVTPQPIDSTFRDWLRDRRGESPSKYPVVLVTSEGGGIRAAIMTAMVLDELRARYSDFPHHVFAVVGVSGGSVGAVGYAAALYQGLSPGRIAAVAANPGSESWQTTFNTNLLSPAIRSLLGWDLLARLVPRNLFGLEKELEESDRARALEDGWAESWRRTTKKDIANLNFEDLRPSASAAKTDQPALLLLTTSTTTGEPMAISHVRFPYPSRASSSISAQEWTDPGKPALWTLADVSPGIDLPLATAAFMSARFPFISPPARLPGDGLPRRYVDGGYYDNSGVSTILDILHAIRSEASGKAKILIIRIENGGASESADQDKQRESFIDLGAPFDALYNTRLGHGSAATAALDNEIALSTDCANPKHCLPVQQAIFRLSKPGVPLPLGWYISGPEREEIARQLLEPYNEHSFATVGNELGLSAKLVGGQR